MGESREGRNKKNADLAQKLLNSPVFQIILSSALSQDSRSFWCFLDFELQFSAGMVSLAAISLEVGSTLFNKDAFVAQLSHTRALRGAEKTEAVLQS